MNMIKVVKHGRLKKHIVYQKECPVCGCVFTFEKNDLEVIHERGNSIRCPECRQDNFLLEYLWLYIKNEE